MPKPRKNPHDLTAPPTQNGLTVDSLYPPRGSFPGDTVKVQDPPTSNGGSQDSFGDEKGLKAPPGARGEYTERPPGNLGGPGGSIGVSPYKFKVDEDNIHRRNQIPPMYLPAVASKIIAENEALIDNEDEPQDAAEWKRLHDYEKGLIPMQKNLKNTLISQPAPDAPEQPVGTGLDFKDFFSQVTRGEFGMSDVPWEPILPLEGLEPFLDQYAQVSGNFAAHIAKSIPAFQEVQLKTGNAVAQTLPPGSRVLDIGASEGNWGKAISAATKGGVQTVSLDPNPDMQNTFNSKPAIPGATYELKSFQYGFDDPAMGAVQPLAPQGDFDVVHEAMAFQFITPDRAGNIAEVKRHLKPGGVALIEEKVFNDAWDANEQKKDAEYKSRYFTPQALQDKDKMVGFQQDKQETGTVGMLDNMVSQQALEDALLGNFRYVVQYWDSGNFKGYAASDDRAKLDAIVGAIADTSSPFSTVATPRMVTPSRQAFSVHPIPAQPRVQDERLLLQIPHDVQERYSDLDRRVSDYVKSLKLNTLDMYDFPAEPPEKWVEEERLNVPVDWNDDHAWSAYMGRLSHDDVADWIGLDALDHERLAGIAPDLARQHALEAGTTQPFAEWFRSRKPTITDQNLIRHVKDSAQAFPQHGLGKGYAGYWRRRNHEMVRETATARARERHDRYLREVAYHDYVRPNYAESFEAIQRAREERQPLSDTVRHLHSLPVEGAERDTVDDFRNEFEGLLNEGVHALDLYREPVSRDDRMFGDMESQGLKWVPVRKIAGVVSGVEFPENHQIGMKVPKGGSSCAKCVYVSEDHTQCGEKHFQEWNGSKDLPEPADEYCCDFFKSKRSATSEVIQLYRYGDRYFFVHETDREAVSEDMLMIRAMVFNIVPGSSITKRANANWDRKSRALAQAINFIKTGGDREAAFVKFGREYGPGLRKAVSDYLFITQQHKKSDGGGGSSGSNIGDATCSSFDQQSPDNCDGCTFNVGTGGPEFGYGDGACLLTHLFLNAPDKGFGRGDQNAYQPQRTPGTPSLQNLNKTRRSDPRLP